MLKHYTRAISIAGALIVFATFIVKDAIRDHVKDVVDSLDLAKSEFLIRSDSGIHYELLNQISQRVDIIWNTTPDRAKYLQENADRGDADSDLDDLEKVNDQSEANINRIGRLIEQMPYADPLLNQSFDELTRRFKVLKEAERRAAKKLSNTKTTYDDIFFDLEEIGTECETLSSDLHSFADRVLSDFDTRRTKEEHFYNESTWVSYGLYVLGWSLAFIGRLFGIDGFAGSD